MSGNSTLVEHEAPEKLLAQRGLFAGPSQIVSEDLYAEISQGIADRERHRMVVHPHATVSMNTYFGRFPATYWQRWCVSAEVELSLTLTGSGTVSIVASDAEGESRTIVAEQVSGAQGQVVTMTARIDKFTDGGALWFDVVTGEHQLVVEQARWTVAPPKQVRPTAIVICTFNRVEDCLNTMAALASDPEPLGLVDAVYVIDQGSDPVESRARFAEVAAALGDKLRYIRQPNLGGAGGFTRGLYQVMEVDHAEHANVLFMDDDVLCEPEIVVRTTAFANRTAQPVIVGGQMLYLLHPNHLHVGAEYANLDTLAPGQVVEGALHDADLTGHDEETGKRNVQDRRVDAGYNGWWSCLIPSEIVKAVGYPLPLFFQWDDIEYGYRARAHGFATVTLPGAGVWHADFHWKDWDDWHRYFNLRNALITSALHSQFEPKRICRSMAAQLATYLVGMQYGLAATQLKAIEDFLKGPEMLRDGGVQAAADIRKLRAEYPETVKHPASEVPGIPSGDLPLITAPPAPRLFAPVLAKRVVNQLLGRSVHDVGAVSAGDSAWWHVSLFNTAVVTDASQEGVRVRRRDRELAIRLGKQGTKLLKELYQRAPEMQRAYRDAMDELTSRENWRRLSDLGPVERGGPERSPRFRSPTFSHALLTWGPSVDAVHRIILPRDDDPLDVRPMYLDEPENVHCQVDSRRGLTVPEHAKVSFATYFNAFPASYWKRWTVVDEVVLRMCVRGSGRVDVYRSKPSGDVVHLEGSFVRDAADWTALEFPVSLRPFEDGGLIWFDAFTHEAPLEIQDAEWAVRSPLPVKKVAVSITTMRPHDAVEALRALGSDPAVLDVVSNVFVADQGAVKVRSVAGFAEAEAGLGGRLEVIEQDNLGGAGGFTRGMFEAVEHTDADQIMLMDDDIRLEPEAVLRSNAFARAAASPVIVGSHMLNLQARTRIHSTAEIVDLGTCFWRAAPGAVTDHDFAVSSLRETPELHPRVDATYNGWWMCLFPREVVERTGYPLPLFIKWDDAEYSLRALEHGYPTVSLPGSAVWHMPWTDKNDSTDWQAYFHTRNRLVLAALHSPYDVRSGIVKHGLKLSLRHLLSMEYSTVALQQKAIEDFLDGPAGLFDSLRTALPMVRAMREEYSDARRLESAREFPPPTFDMVRAEALLRPSKGKATIAVRAAKSVLHNLRPPQASAGDRPQLNVPALNARWFLLGNLDSATVSTADGTGVAFYKRDPDQFRTLMARAVRNYRRLGKEWPRLRRLYRDALPELTSTEQWRKAFENR